MGRRSLETIAVLGCCAALLGCSPRGNPPPDAGPPPLDAGLAPWDGGLLLVEGQRLGEGIFAINLADRTIVQLAAIPVAGTGGDFVKYDFLDRGDGTFDFAYVPDLEGNLYSFQASFAGERLSATAPVLRLAKSDRGSLNGPAYCRRRGQLGFGFIEPSRVGLEQLDAAALGGLQGSSVEAAGQAGLLASYVTSDLQISTDLACGELEQGLVFNHLDCRDSASVYDCLGGGQGQGISEIHHQPSAQAAEVALTFPGADPRIAASPGRAPGTTLGDNGPALVGDADGGLHLLFERLYTTAEVFDGGALADEFRSGGFDALYYKHLAGDPQAATEYAVDFSRWLPRPAEHASVLTSDLRHDPARPGGLEFAALVDFKSAQNQSGADLDVYVGLVRGHFDPAALPAQPTLSLGPEQVEGVLTFAQFTCQLWDRYGSAPDGNVYLYALYLPRLLRDARGRDFLVFSTFKGLAGTADAGDDVQLRAYICGP